MIKQLIVIGKCGLQSSVITGVKNIFFSGIMSIDDCFDAYSSNLTRKYPTIISNLSVYNRFNDRTLTITTDGTYQFKLICSTHDECNIKCISDKSCRNICVDCYGTCHISYSPGMSCT